MKQRRNWMGGLVLGLCVSALINAVAGCAPSSPSIEQGREALQSRTVLPWDLAVGRIIGDESAGEGPMSFALKPDGGSLILDQVNQRVLDLDARGRVVGTIELPAATFEDIELYEERAVLVLDRHVGKVLNVFDRQGSPLGETPVEGRGIERSGSISAMLPRPDGVWLEVDRRHSVRVLDRQLQPCQRQVVYGRPIANGQSLRGELDGGGGALISVGPRTELAATRSVTLRSEAPIVRIPFLNTDANGGVHVVLHEVRRSQEPPFEVEHERYVMVVLDEHLVELERSESPWVLTDLDQHVEFRLGRDGHLHQMAFTPDGVTLLNWGGGQL